ncbi:prophage antirepressor [Phascolarctobacterium succinatutens CAG:287]|uniref:Prophage antirepressor n=1 Tax=Phascolarctobacterium succinatutens CAG:287 TaxID=1263101 RepID=R6WX82_9FIRM|nr:phage antirepressor [Phascolarctobacterium succinatutens]CDD11529.1 prophage antirepressor [Phascolarctobacterium succinatutens CAG:287]
MNNLQIFDSPDFGQIRTIQQNGEPWFVGKDVADILGYQNGSRDVNRHVDEDDRQNYQNGTFESNRGLTIINESGLYSLILSSKMPKAKEFKRWVTSEVIPAIRKTGGYIAGSENMTDAEIMAKAVLVAQSTIRQRDQRIKELESDVAAAKPKVLFADAVSASDSTILIGDLAKILKQNGHPIGQKRLFNWMREQGYLIKRAGADYNSPTQRAMEMGLFKIKETAISHSDGHVSVSKTTKVTGKGQQYFINKFCGA